MHRLIRIIGKFGGTLLCTMAMVVGAASVNAACVIWFHQPDVPNEMAKFKKI